MQGVEAPGVEPVASRTSRKPTFTALFVARVAEGLLPIHLKSRALIGRYTFFPPLCYRLEALNALA